MVHFVSSQFELGAFKPVLLEFLGGPGDFVFEPFPGLSLLGICDRSVAGRKLAYWGYFMEAIGYPRQEVTCRLSGRALPSHFLEICSSLVCWAKVYLPSLVEHDRLVAQVVNGLRSLVNGDKRCETSDVTSNFERTDKLEGGL